MAQRFLRYAAGNGNSGAKESQYPAQGTGERQYLYATNAGINLGSTEVFAPGLTGTVGSPDETNSTFQIYFANDNNGVSGADGNTYGVRCFGQDTTETEPNMIAYVNEACEKMITISVGGTGGTINSGMTTAGYPWPTTGSVSNVLGSLNDVAAGTTNEDGMALLCIYEGSIAT